MSGIAWSANVAWSATAPTLQSEVLLHPFDEAVEGDVVGAERALLAVLLDHDGVDRSGRPR